MGIFGCLIRPLQSRLSIHHLFGSGLPVAGMAFWQRSAYFESFEVIVAARGFAHSDSCGKPGSEWQEKNFLHVVV
jgi:hypothetical protein